MDTLGSAKASYFKIEVYGEWRMQGRGPGGRRPLIFGPK